MKNMPKRHRRYTNPVDRKRYGVPKTDLEIFFSNTVQAEPYARRCATEDCREDIWNRTPLCKQHAWDLWFLIDLEIEKGKAQEEIQAAAKRHADHEDMKDKMFDQKVQDSFAPYKPKPLATAPGMVYYLQVGELIKIGYSQRVENRIKSYPPDSKLLATHPGTIKTEQQMHYKFFNDLAHGREWFTPSPELEQHIQDVRKQFPQHNKI